jgi:hypothetical protein
MHARPEGGGRREEGGGRREEGGGRREEGGELLHVHTNASLILTCSFALFPLLVPPALGAP